MDHRKSDPKLSIVMCVYNTERYVRESLESVFNQPFKNFELIIINDGSTDGTRDILIEYAERSNVRLLENKFNEGIPVSRNRGLLCAKGRYIAIHDADDIVLPERFIRQVRYLDNHDEIVVLGTHAFKINTVGQVVGSMVYPPNTTEKAYRLIHQAKFNPIIDPSSMYRRDIILDYGGYSMESQWRTVSDFHLWCRLLSNNLRISNLEERLIKYRLNPDGLTRTKQDEMIKATDMVWAAFKRKNLPKQELRRDYFEQDSFTEYCNE